MKIETSRHMSMHVYTAKVGRLTIKVTNRPQLFEEKRLPSFKGWWVQVIRRAKA